MISFTLVRETLGEIVSENPGFRYKRPSPTIWSSNCVYFHEGKPSCIVGHLLARLGIDIEWNDDTNTDNIRGLSRTVGLPFDVGTIDYLEVLQDNQDSGMTWGYSLHAADNTLVA